MSNCESLLELSNEMDLEFESMAERKLEKYIIRMKLEEEDE